MCIFKASQNLNVKIIFTVSNIRFINSADDSYKLNKNAASENITVQAAVSLKDNQDEDDKKARTAVSMSKHILDVHARKENQEALIDPLGALLDAVLIQRTNIEMSKPMKHHDLIQVLEARKKLSPVSAKTSNMINLMLNFLNLKTKTSISSDEKIALTNMLEKLKHTVESYTENYSADDAKFLKELFAE
jgi:hypothetical protein